MSSMAKIQSGDVHAGLDHFPQHLHGIASRADRANNPRFAGLLRTIASDFQVFQVLDVSHRTRVVIFYDSKKHLKNEYLEAIQRHFYLMKCHRQKYL